MEAIIVLVTVCGMCFWRLCQGAKKAKEDE